MSDPFRATGSPEHHGSTGGVVTPDLGLRWFKVYPACKDSGLDWLGEIPSHWEVKRLRHIVRRIEQGWSPECENRQAHEDEWGVLKAGCVNRGSFVESEHKALPSSLAPMAELEIAEGDVLMSRASGSRELVGSVAVVPKCRPRLLLCDKIFRLQVAIGAADRRFLAYALNSQLGRWQIEGVLSGGSGLANNIAQEVLKDLVLTGPALDEQRAIADFLDLETAKIDTLLEKKERLIELLEEKRAALITRAVTKGLDPTVPMKDSGVEWLGEIPAHWEVNRLRHSVRPGTAISYGIVQPGPHIESGVPFVQTTNITNGNFSIQRLQKTSPDIERNYHRTRLEKGDVLLGIRASIGAAHVVPEILRGANLSRGIARIVVSEQFTSAFLVLFLRSQAAGDYWKIVRQGTTFDDVAIGVVKELVLPVPPIVEQESIVRFADNGLERIDALVSAIRRAVACLRELRTGLISAAVTGKIDVRDED